jgi:alkanesulfonate monooxygenase SsuD/methylene tetrahydromethanopterin reductase-like flavin-dependent oxidoreductase (luciferase family)
MHALVHLLPAGIPLQGGNAGLGYHAAVSKLHRGYGSVAGTSAAAAAAAAAAANNSLFAGVHNLSSHPYVMNEC